MATTAENSPTNRERLRFLVPRALAFTILVALPVAVVLAWLARRFALGQGEQLALLFVAVPAFRFVLRPVGASLFIHPADRDGEDRAAHGLRASTWRPRTPRRPGVARPPTR